jgi:hypothetical protein
MRVLLHLKPGQKGTKKLCAQYGDRLICVRYRYDPQRKKRFKTVELIVEERDWEPSAPRIKVETVVGIRVNRLEIDLRQQVKRAGGKWNPQRQVWELRHDQVVALGLEARMVGGKSI